MSWKKILKEEEFITEGNLEIIPKEKLSDDDLREQYDDMLDEVYGEVKLGNLTFSPSRIIRELDETAYRIGLYEYEDSLLEDEDYE